MARNRAAALAELRAARAGGKKRDYVVEEANDLYQEVDEEGYKKVVRDRLDRDDFVVDDNGEGYVDDGREDWETRQQDYNSMSEDDMPVSKSTKRKREEEPEKKRETKDIAGFFSNNLAEVTKKTKPKAVPTEADKDFLASILGEVDANHSTRRAPMKPIKSEARRKTRVLSPPVSENKPAARKATANVDTTDYMVDTPPAETAFDDDGYMPAVDDSVPTSDPPMPSSPVAQAAERKTQVIVKEEEEDEDLMEVEQVSARAGVQSASVNMTGSRPIKKLPKPQYPTPDSSSPIRPPTEPVIDASAWNNVTEKLNVLSSPANETSSIGKLKPSSALEDDGSLHMFWMDYTEVNGSLCLFGKVKDKTTGDYVSCFMKIDNILRKLYFLPRETRMKHGRNTDEGVEMSDVYQEVDGIMSRLHVGMHKIKPCTRKYAFELADIPKEADYLKLLYPYNKPALDMEMKGETFSHVFGSNTSLFEQFVLWKNLMGPCWLKVEGADFNAVNNASWCKLELQVDKPNNIITMGNSDNLEAPPLTLMSISLRTTFNAKDNKQEILMASARIYENVSLTDTTPPEKMPCKTFTVMRPSGDAFPMGFKAEVEKHRGTVKLEKTEQGLLSVFMAIMQKMDPDVLMGHKLDDVDYGILLNRMRERKTPGWHRIGRLRRSEWPKNVGKGGGSFFTERQLAAGRLLCDLANDLGRSLMMKCQSWTLNEMCELVLGEGNTRRDIDNEAALKTWATTREGLMNYLRHCEADTYFIAAISLKVQMLPLTKVLTNLAGNSWARTLSGTRAERNEYILLHEFYRNKYICPDKVWGKPKVRAIEDEEEGEEGAGTKKKDKYKGGLVFEPEKGLYDKFILVMDFNSLYPSIIQEFNICFTTVERSDFVEEDDKVPEVPTEQEKGILPRLISTLVNRRREVKKLMKDPTATSDQLQTWDIKQLALKLTANSMYGCLGYTKSRFYARPLAMLTTHKGREILRATKNLAEEKFQLRVIYGDTDSVMINTNVDNIQEAVRLGNDFKKGVNENYKLLEIDIDNIFRRILLHAKKKYAAINMVQIDGKYVEKLEVKGLDMRRREYCALSKETSSKLLNFLLSGNDPETVVNNIHEYLRTLSTKMRAYEVPVQKYTIFTQLGKDPKDYPNANSMPSVQVALRQMAKGKHIKAKDVMSFIITGNSSGSAETAAKNAFTLEEVLKQGSELKPDIDYYLHKQILPPVERLCAPIEQTNVTQLAECLGLDTSKYRVSNSSSSGGAQDTEIHPLESQIPDEVRFKTSSPLSVRCNACHTAFLFRGLSHESSPTVLSHEGIRCPNTAGGCGKTVPVVTLVAQLETQIHQHVARYYAGWLVCDDPSCSSRTRQMSVYGHKCLGPAGLAQGCRGKMGFEYSEKEIYNQLLYLSSLFDVDRALKGMETEGEMGKVKVLGEVNRERFETVKGVVAGYLERNGRQWVAMDSIFGFAIKAQGL